MGGNLQPKLFETTGIELGCRLGVNTLQEDGVLIDLMFVVLNIIVELNVFIMDRI